MKQSYKKLKKSKSYKRAFHKGKVTRAWIGYIIQAGVLILILTWGVIRKPRVIKVSRWTIIITLWAIFMTFKWVQGKPTVVYNLNPKDKVTTTSQSHIDPTTIVPKPLLTEYTVPNTSPGYNDYDWGNCTYGVASWIGVPAGLGNANTWATNAAAMGYPVSNEPLKGAVGVSTAGYYGHVVLVLQTAPGMVYVREENVQGLGAIDEAWYPISTFTYIYF